MSFAQKHISKSIDFRHFFNANRFKFQSDQRNYKLSELKEKCLSLSSSDSKRHELLRELENDVENFKWIMRNGKSDVWVLGEFVGRVVGVDVPYVPVLGALAGITGQFTS